VKPGSVEQCLLADGLLDLTSTERMRRMLDSLQADQKQLHISFVDEFGYGSDKQQISTAYVLLKSFGLYEQNFVVHQADDTADGILKYLSQHPFVLLILQKRIYNWLECLFVPSVVRQISAQMPIPLLILPD